MTLRFTSRLMPRPLVSIMLVCLLLCQMTFFTIPAKALPPQGWVEIKATVPEGFQEDLCVVLQASDGSSRTVYVLAENNYIGRMQLTCGTYDVMSAGVVNDMKMRFPTDWSPYVVEIKESGAAAPITMTVTAPDTYSPIISSGAKEEPSSSSIDLDAQGTVSENTMNNISETPESSETIDASHSASDSSRQQEETPESSPESEGRLTSTLRNIVIILMAMAVFVAIVCVVVYFVRNREF